MDPGSAWEAHMLDPPDERPRRSWNFTHEKKIIIETEGRKMYTVASGN